MTQLLLVFYSPTLRHSSKNNRLALEQISKRLQSDGYRVVWMSIDSLGCPDTEYSNIPWLRLSDPASSRRCWRCYVRQADKIVPALNAIAADVLIPWSPDAYKGAKIASLVTGIPMLLKEDLDSVQSKRLSRNKPLIHHILLMLLCFIISPKRALRLRKELLDTSQLASIFLDRNFYQDYYLTGGSRLSPLGHYLAAGQYAGYNPHPLFWQRWYSQQYLGPESSVLPLLHFDMHGTRNGSLPNPTFHKHWVTRGLKFTRSGVSMLTQCEQMMVRDNEYCCLNPLVDPIWYRNNCRNTESTLIEDFLLQRGRCAPCEYLSKHPELRLKLDDKDDLSYIPAFERKFIYSPSIYPKNKRLENTDNDGRTAVCCVSTGNYDHLNTIYYKDLNTDYYFFTNRIPKHNNNGWKVILLESMGMDDIGLSRYAKMHLSKLLPGYDEYSVIVYLDANISLVGSIRNIINKYLMSGASLGVIPHPHRSCVYQEAAAILLLDKDKTENVIRCTDFLEKQGLPINSGLFEMNFFCYRQSSRANSFFNYWWHLYRRLGKRDQLLAPYVAWKQKQNLYPLLPHGESVRSHPSFKIRPHK